MTLSSLFYSLAKDENLSKSSYETGDQRWPSYCLQMHVAHDPFNFFFESHVAPANTWHCPIRWGIKGSYKPHSLGPTDLRNATISFHCTSTQELAPVTQYCLLVE
ncbi:hypothetical protein VNO80_04086 [Phaseolus coccineus]|uniref:Uncharacterized protein n=1 Tax=Phaseolus coccineus TaxID=3886 RepID=A0AAN9NUB2_PHACN